MSIWAMGRIGGNLAREALEICLDSEIESLALELALTDLQVVEGFKTGT